MEFNRRDLLIKIPHQNNYKYIAPTLKIDIPEASWVVGRFGWLACSNAYKSHTYVESFHLETPYQISTKSVEKCQSYARFSLLGR